MAYGHKEIIEKIRELSLPSGQYLVAGGGSLAVRDIRETRDLDIIVLPALFQKLISEGWELDTEYHRKWNRDRVKKNDVEMYPDMYLEEQDKFLDIQELIANADVIEGIPFQPLKHLMECKMGGAREKDLNDVELIKKYLAVRT